MTPTFSPVKMNKKVCYLAKGRVFVLFGYGIRTIIKRRKNKFAETETLWKKLQRQNLDISPHILMFAQYLFSFVR